MQEGPIWGNFIVSEWGSKPYRGLRWRTPYPGQNFMTLGLEAFLSMVFIFQKNSDAYFWYIAYKIADEVPAIIDYDPSHFSI